MKAITEGHKYELDNHENPMDVPKQTLQFIEKKPAGDDFPPGSLITVNEGTTNEEVLRVPSFTVMSKPAGSRRQRVSSR